MTLLTTLLEMAGARPPVEAQIAALDARLTKVEQRLTLVEAHLRAIGVAATQGAQILADLGRRLAPPPP